MAPMAPRRADAEATVSTATRQTTGRPTAPSLEEVGAEAGAAEVDEAAGAAAEAAVEAAEGDESGRRAKAGLSPSDESAEN